MYITVPRNSNFIGQRADKALVVDVGNEVETVDTGGGFVKNGVLKEVERYTITCPDCDGDGYYDRRGDIVCEDCGVVINDQPVAVRGGFDQGRGFSNEHDSDPRSRGNLDTAGPSV
jgi:hypothetical protein